jgi:hypothetical protein
MFSLFIKIVSVVRRPIISSYILLPKMRRIVLALLLAPSWLEANLGFPGAANSLDKLSGLIQSFTQAFFGAGNTSGPWLIRLIKEYYSRILIYLFWSHDIAGAAARFSFGALPVSDSIWLPPPAPTAAAARSEIQSKAVTASSQG